MSIINDASHPSLYRTAPLTLSDKEKLEVIKKLKKQIIIVVSDAEKEAFSRQCFLEDNIFDDKKIWVLMEWEKKFNKTWCFNEREFDTELAIKELKEAGFSVSRKNAEKIDDFLLEEQNSYDEKIEEIHNLEKTKKL